MGCLNGYRHRLAYRHDNGHIEGFEGDGLTREKARADAIRQVQRKLAILRQAAQPGAAADDLGTGFDPLRVINGPISLTVGEGELATLRRDWESGLRY